MEGTEMAGMPAYEYLFSQSMIAGLTFENRLIRAATWDPSLLAERRMTAAVLDVYRQLAAGGIGAILTGDIPVVPEGFAGRPRCVSPGQHVSGGEGRRFCGTTPVPCAWRTRPVGSSHNSARMPMGFAPSKIPSPYTQDQNAEFSACQIAAIITCFVNAIEGLQQEGFDGVELHAAPRRSFESISLTIHQPPHRSIRRLSGEPGANSGRNSCLCPLTCRRLPDRGEAQQHGLHPGRGRL